MKIPLQKKHHTKHYDIAILKTSRTDRPAVINFSTSNRSVAVIFLMRVCVADGQYYYVSYY